MNYQKKLFAVYKNELRALFFTPVSWLILIVFSVQNSYIFVKLLSQVISNKELDLGLSSMTKMFFMGKEALFISIIPALFIYIPLLTMNTISKEFGDGTHRLWFSSPIKGRDIVLGKYFSLIFYGFILMLSYLPLILAAYFIVPDLAVSVVFSGLLGIFFLFSVYVAIGIFMSSLTTHPIIAGLYSFFVLFLLNFIGNIGESWDFIRDITYWLSFRGRTENMIQGLILSNDVFYFIIIIVFFLMLTLFRIRFIQNPPLLFKKIRVLSLTAFLSITLGLLTAQPNFIWHYDATPNKVHSISEKSKQIMNKANRQPILITNFVNIADYNNWVAVPSAINEDKSRFRPFVLDYPNIDFDYVYYKAEPLKNQDYNDPYRLPTQELVKIFSKVNHLNEKNLLSAQEVFEMYGVDTKKEENSVFKTVSMADRNKKTVLRLFDDMKFFPSENEISIAIKGIIDKNTSILFVNDIGSRTLKREEGKEYTDIFEKKSSRNSLINQGFDIWSLSLDEAKEFLKREENALLVLPDMNENCTLEKQQTLLRLIDEGKNILLLLSRENKEKQQFILKKLAIDLLDGKLLHLQKKTDSEIIPCVSTPFFAEIAPMLMPNAPFIMKNTSALDYYLHSSFEVIPLLQTKNKSCLRIRDNEHSQNMNDLLETNKNIYITALGLSRKINQKQQKIVVTANADFISNKELRVNYEDLFSLNSNFLLYVMYWLSDNNSPILIKEKQDKDNQIALSLGDFPRIRNTIYFIPLLLLVSAFLVLWRRKRRNA